MGTPRGEGRHRRQSKGQQTDVHHPSLTHHYAATVQFEQLLPSGVGNRVGDVSIGAVLLWVVRACMCMRACMYHVYTLDGVPGGCPAILGLASFRRFGHGGGIRSQSLQQYQMTYCVQRNFRTPWRLQDHIQLRFVQLLHSGLLPLVLLLLFSSFYP